MSGWEGMGADPEPPRRVGRTQNGQGVAVLDPANIASLQPWQDATYQEATRALDPQFQQAEARFNQDMVNRGIAQGSEAYTNARSDFDRSRNDAYGSARNQALAQALAAQNQGFQQSFGLDQVAAQQAQDAAVRASTLQAAAVVAERLPEAVKAGAIEPAQAERIGGLVASIAASAAVEQARKDEPATLKLGVISERLGFTMSAAFLADVLRVKPARTDGRSLFYTESQYLTICRQLQSHVGAMAEMYAGEPA